mgnify:CR=1 FL=1
MIRNLFIALIVFACLPLDSLSAQEFNAHDAFNKALILYRNRNYEQAKIQFLTLSARRSGNPRQTAALLMLTKTFYALHDYENALHYADQLINSYPESRYRAFAHAVKAAVFRNEGDSQNALSELVEAVEFAPKAELQNRCESAGTELVTSGMPIKAFERVYKSKERRKAAPILSIWRAQVYHQNGESNEALKIITDFLAANPDARYRNIAERQKTQFQQQPSRFRLGLVLPVSGFFANEAKEFMSGMALALTQRKKRSPAVELLLGDSAGSPVETSRKTNELLDMGVQAVVGELESDKSAMVAGLVGRTNVPLIIPVSTDNGLTDDKPNVFQVNSSLQMRAEALARYAVENLGLRTFAALAPEDDYGRTLVEAFSKAVTEMGGIMVTQQWFHPDSTNFSLQFEAIREAGFRQSFRDSLLNIGHQGDATTVDEFYSRRDRNVRRRSEKREGLAKATGIPLTSIHGLFAPMYEEHIPFIASQYALYNLKSVLLSGEHCYNLELLRSQQQYLDGMVFSAGYSFSENDMDYANFVRDYREATSLEPTVMATYGYNLMNLLIEGIDDGAVTAAAMTHYLSNVDDFQGIGTVINIKNRMHVNQYVSILQFVGGNIYRMNSSN